MVWGKRNPPIAVPLTNERQRQTYSGAMNLRTQTVHLQAQPRGEGGNTVA
jgi:putative transposase